LHRKKQKNLARKNAVKPLFMGLCCFYGVGVMQIMKMVGIGEKWAKFVFLFA
jgi:hypothetical protein